MIPRQSQAARSRIGASIDGLKTALDIRGPRRAEVLNQALDSRWLPDSRCARLRPERARQRVDAGNFKECGTDIAVGRRRIAPEATRRKRGAE